MKLRQIEGQGRDARTHVVLVHGLNGSTETHWRLDDEAKTFWPKWLSEDVEGVGVWALDYDAQLSRWKGHSTPLSDCAEQFVKLLLIEKQLSSGTICLVGYSLGGIVIKQALLAAKDRSEDIDPRAGSLLSRIRGVVFYGTPHHGSPLSEVAVRYRWILRAEPIAISLAFRNDYIKELNARYNARVVNHSVVDHLVFAENFATEYRALKFLKMSVWVVPPHSSDTISAQRYLIDKDHRTIAKPETREEFSYQVLRDFIERLPAGPRGPASVFAQRPIGAAHDAPVQAASQRPKHLGGQERLWRAQSELDYRLAAEVERLRTLRTVAEFDARAEAESLAGRVQSGGFSHAASASRANALAWCARIELNHDLNLSSEYLQIAQSIEITEMGEIVSHLLASREQSHVGPLVSLLSMGTREAVSAWVIAQQNRVGSESALAILDSEGYQFEDLLGDAQAMITGGLIEVSDWDAAIDLCGRINMEESARSVSLQINSALARVAATVPKSLRKHVSITPPFSIMGFPLFDTPDDVASRAIAAEEMERASILADAHGLVGTAGLARTYTRWLRLRDPLRRDGAKSELMEVYGIASRSFDNSVEWIASVPIYIAIAPDLNRDEIMDSIRRIEVPQWLSHLRAVALLAAIAQSEDGAELLRLLDENEGILKPRVAEGVLVGLRVEALASEGHFDQAMELLAKSDVLDQAERRRLSLVVRGERTGEHHAELKRAWEDSSSIDDLEALVRELHVSEKWVDAAKYARRLFEETLSADKLLLLCSILMRLGEMAAIAEVCSGNQGIVDGSDDLELIQLLAIVASGRPRIDSTQRDWLLSRFADDRARRCLFGAVIYSGDWSAIPAILERVHDVVRDVGVQELASYCAMGVAFAYTRTNQLISALADRAWADAEGLVAAYVLAVKADLAEELDAFRWLERAYQLSEPDRGPIQKVDLEWIVEQAPEWRRRSDWLNLSIRNAEIPYSMAVDAANRTLLQATVGVFARNERSADLRDVAIVPLYSGSRTDMAPASWGKVAASPMALLTLAHFGWLEAIQECCASVLLPVSVMDWLFAERLALGFHQPSRIRFAEAVSQLETSNVIRRAPSFSGNPRVALVAALGRVRADLVEAVARRGKAVAVLSGTQEGGAPRDLGAPIMNPHRLLELLHARGALTRDQLDPCRTFLASVAEGAQNLEYDVDLRHEPDEVFLDALTFGYLWQLDLLRVLPRAFSAVFVEQQVFEEASQLLEYRATSSDMSDALERIRSFVERGLEDGSVNLGFAPPDHDEDRSEVGPATRVDMDIFRLIDGYDGVLMDDRFFNAHKFLEHAGKRVPVYTSAQLLSLSKSVTLRDAKVRLINAGVAVLLPNKSELNEAIDSTRVDDNEVRLSPEALAYEKALLLLRANQYLPPGEERRTLVQSLSTCLELIVGLWMHVDSDAEERRAAEISRWLWSMCSSKDWALLFNEADEQSGRLWVNTYVGQITALIARALAELDDSDRFCRWLDDSIISEERAGDPVVFEALVDSCRSLLLRITNMELDQDGDA